MQSQDFNQIQPFYPEQSSATQTKSSNWIIPLLTLTTLLFLFLTVFFAYLYLQSTQAPPANDNPTIIPEASSPPVSPTTLDNYDQTTNWQSYTNKELGISLKHPADEPISDNLGDPNKGNIKVNRLVTISPYEDRLSSDYYQTNPEIIQPNNEILPITIDGQQYNFMKSVWGDGGGDQGTQQLTYFIDIPDKISIDLRFQKILHYDDPSLDYLQVVVNGDFIKIDESEINTALQILSTIQFIEP